MTTWTFIWLILILKIPIVALFLIVRWAVRQTPETETGLDGGIGPRPHPTRPYHPRPELPRLPRRGPHGSPAPAPARMRIVSTGAVSAGARTPHR